MAYNKTKGVLKESVKALDLGRRIFVRLGLIVGDRRESRRAEAMLRSIAGVAGALGDAFKRPWAQVSLQATCSGTVLYRVLTRI
jgi:hypothetical protein